MRAALDPQDRPRSHGTSPGTDPPFSSGRGYGVGTLLGCVPGIIRPLPPTVLVSSCPNRGDRDHDRVGPIPTTARQPDVWIRTGRKLCPPAANTSRNIPPKSAGHCSPGGMGGSAQSAAARARTRGASVIVMPRGRSSRRWPAGRLATTRSTFWAAAQSGTPADAPATAVGPVEWPARRGRVPGTAGRCAAARCQHDHSADGDHGQHPPCGRVRRPAPPVSRIYRLAITHHRSLPSLSPSCRGLVRSGQAPRCRHKRGGSDHPSSPGLSARRGRRAGRFRPRRRSRLQDWTARSPPRFLLVGQSHRSGSSAHIADVRTAQRIRGHVENLTTPVPPARRVR